MLLCNIYALMTVAQVLNAHECGEYRTEYKFFVKTDSGRNMQSLY